MTLDNSESQISELAPHFTKLASLFIISSKECFPFCQETALKMKEVCYIHAEAFLAGNFSHGPMALINESAQNEKQKTKVICLLNESDNSERVFKVIKEIQSKNGWVALITNIQNISEITDVVPDFVVKVPFLKHFDSFLTILPMQLLVLKIAQLKQLDIDNPKNITKFVAF